MADIINANPTIIDLADLPTRSGPLENDSKLHEDINSLSLVNTNDGNLSDPEVQESDEEMEEIDSQEIFDLLATISDPEHPLSLAQLAVVNLNDISVKNGSKDELSQVIIKITPTITHCSLATLIGLGIRVRLERCLPARFRIKILVKEGTHQSENQVNKQLNDKERVAAACENEQLLSVILQMLSTCK